MFVNATEAPSKGKFEPHPKGLANGVCVEVITHNKEGVPYSKTIDGKVKNKIILVFQTEKTTEKDDGTTVNCAYWDWHNIPESIANENSSLHKRLKGWEVPIEDFDTKEAFEDAVIGRPCLLMFSHNTSEGTTYANIEACTPIEEGAEAFVARDYKAFNPSAPF